MNVAWAGGGTLAAKIDKSGIDAALSLALAGVRSSEPLCDDCDGHPNCICEIADAQYPMTRAEQLDDALNGRR